MSKVCAGSCGFGKIKHKKKTCDFGKSKRKSYKKVSKKSKKMSKKSKKSYKKMSKKGSRKNRFGKISSLSKIMGNNAQMDMSLMQAYVGNSPSQQEMHLTGVPINLRTNFYTNV
jgi:hypothetical protein